jgi:hypothetical protein
MRVRTPSSPGGPMRSTSRSSRTFSPLGPTQAVPALAFQRPPSLPGNENFGEVMVSALPCGSRTSFGARTLKDSLPSSSSVTSSKFSSV